MRMWPLARIPARTCWSTSVLPTMTWPRAARASWQRSAPAEAAPLGGPREVRAGEPGEPRPEDRVEVPPAPGAVGHVVAEGEEAHIQLGDRGPRGRRVERRDGLGLHGTLRPAQHADAPRGHDRRA